MVSGRRFNIGTMKGVAVIYAMTGEEMLNAGIVVQILIDVFNIEGIVHYGTAGSTNDSLSLGDVSVPNYVAFTDSWKWKCGSYNFPSRDDNLLANVEFTPQQLYSTGQPMQEVFWLPIEPNWFSAAMQLSDINLQRCINNTYCLPETPKIVYGLRSSTADIFLDNAAYREFLFKEFNISTVGREFCSYHGIFNKWSAMYCVSWHIRLGRSRERVKATSLSSLAADNALSVAVEFISLIGKASLTNGVPCIVFCGVSGLARVGKRVKATSLSSLAAVNALSVAVEFISLIGKVNPIQYH